MPLRTVCQVAIRPSEPCRPVSVETLHPAEIKHAICVRSFRGMRSFHVVAACGTAAAREPGMRGGSGPRGRRSVDGIEISARLQSPASPSLRFFVRPAQNRRSPPCGQRRGRGPHARRGHIGERRSIPPTLRGRNARALGLLAAGRAALGERQLAPVSRDNTRVRPKTPA